MIRLNSLWEFYCLFFCRSIYQPIWYSSLPLFTCMAAILDNNNNNKKILSIYSVKYLTHFSKDSHNLFFSLSLSSSKLFIFFNLNTNETFFDRTSQVHMWTITWTLNSSIVSQQWCTISFHHIYKKKILEIFPLLKFFWSKCFSPSLCKLWVAFFFYILTFLCSLSFFL